MPERPTPLSALLAGILKEAGIAERVEQAAVVPEWPTLVGDQIAAVATPLLVTPDGTLFVAVSTHAWMTELSLMEPELLRALNKEPGRLPIRKIRWQLRR